MAHHRDSRLLFLTAVVTLVVPLACGPADPALEAVTVDAGFSQDAAEQPIIALTGKRVPVGLLLGEADASARDSDSGAGRCRVTSPDALGPFYAAGAPWRTRLAEEEEPGERVIISGQVLGADCAAGLAAATVDVWHADAVGVYHAAEQTFRLRGRMLTDDDGQYRFETIWPGNYDNRPRHYHFIISAPGFLSSTTQLYFSGDPFLGPNDSCQPPTCNSSDPARIIDLSEEVVDGLPRKVGRFDVVLGPS